MLNRFETLAARYRALRTPAWLGFVVMCGVWVWLMVAGSVSLQDRWLIPTVLGTLWFLLFASSLLVFAHVPARPGQGMGLMAGLGRRLQRLLFHLLAWVTLLVTLALVVVSAQLLLAWYREHF